VGRNGPSCARRDRHAGLFPLVNCHLHGKAAGRGQPAIAVTSAETGVSLMMRAAAMLRARDAAGHSRIIDSRGYRRREIAQDRMSAVASAFCLPACPGQQMALS